MRTRACMQQCSGVCGGVLVCTITAVANWLDLLCVACVPRERLTFVYIESAHAARPETWLRNVGSVCRTHPEQRQPVLDYVQHSHIDFFMCHQV